MDGGSKGQGVGSQWEGTGSKDPLSPLQKYGACCLALQHVIMQPVHCDLCPYTKSNKSKILKIGYTFQRNDSHICIYRRLSLHDQRGRRLHAQNDQCARLSKSHAFLPVNAEKHYVINFNGNHPLQEGQCYIPRPSNPADFTQDANK